MDSERDDSARYPRLSKRTFHNDSEFIDNVVLSCCEKKQRKETRLLAERRTETAFKALR